jgi:hypothetical protein
VLYVLCVCACITTTKWLTHTHNQSQTTSTKSKTKTKKTGYPSPYAPPLAKLASADAFARSPLRDAGAPEARVPASFLGLSVDLNDIEGVAHPDYIGLVRHLTEYDTGPMIFRVGAYAADRLDKPWPATVYKALSELHLKTGAKFIVGVNQHAEDPALTDEQVRRSAKLLPKGSIVAFAVGNEPDMYALAPKKGLPGALKLKDVDWMRCGGNFAAFSC